MHDCCAAELCSSTVDPSLPKHILIQYDVGSSSVQLFSSHSFSTVSVSSPVSQLSWTQGQNYILATTNDNVSIYVCVVCVLILSFNFHFELIRAIMTNVTSLSVQVVLIPVEECSSRTDCVSCTADLNPLCGWCVVENKCSRQSQCQNSSDISTVRWTQNSVECLVATATPNQFVLDRPELVSSNKV